MARTKSGPGGPLRLAHRFQSRLKEVMRHARERMHDELEELGEDAEAIAKRLAPTHQPRLIYHREGIQTTVTRTKKNAVREVLRSTSGIGAHLEFGTRHAKAFPHLLAGASFARGKMYERLRRDGLIKGRGGRRGR